MVNRGEDLSEVVGKIKGIISDVDGVLTSGEIIVDGEGNEYKIFNVRDGNGIKIWQMAGYRFAFLSGRKSRPVEVRGKELNVDVIQGSHCKIRSGEDLLKLWGLKWEEVAYIGDDIVDIPIMKKVGFPVAVGDADEEVKSVALYTTLSPGGRGAVREVVEYIMKAKGEWGEIVEKFFSRDNSFIDT